MPPLKVIVDQHASAEAKIALFRSLFRGRDDVYPRRFESRKTGKSGYAPACGNEWVRGVCEKPRIKCAECPNRQFLSLTERVTRWHLSGQDDAGLPFVAGVYPMLLDETCFFLAIDFDKQGWTDDARAFLQTCDRLDVPAILERSRSGRGGHVWCFFDEAIPAGLARRLGSYVLFERRCRGYEALGYEIVLPASAIPGWPTDVHLPSDPLWKRDYAASVRRLVRDGVDVPLAGLFVGAAQPVPAEAEGINRARSASEAFLYRRLDTLQGTRQRFRLNADLAIPFDGRGRMEVDLLCPDARVAVEVDGGAHLGSAEAYRRDRHQDRLLQENGYTVLRFLAEDLAKNLDLVLDAILRALDRRAE